MIKIVEMYVVECDNCHKQCTDEHDGICAWGDQVGARETAISSFWINEDGKDYCSDCYDKLFDDEGNLTSDKQ